MFSSFERLQADNLSVAVPIRNSAIAIRLASIVDESTTSHYEKNA